MTRCLRCWIGFPPLKPRLAVDLDRVAVRQDGRLATPGERPSIPSGKSLQNGVSSSKSSHDNHVFRPKVKGKMELRLVVADDHDIVRRGLRDLLEAHVGWKVVAEAATGTDAVTKVREFSPDVAILDISMPSLNGLEAARRIIQSGSKTRILILTLHDSDRMIATEMLDAGVSGYVLKSDAARDVFVAVEALQHGKTFFTSKIAEMILSGYLKKRQNPPGTEPGREPYYVATTRNSEAIGRRQGEWGRRCCSRDER